MFSVPAIAYTHLSLSSRALISFVDFQEAAQFCFS